MTIMEAERVGNTPLLARAESLGIDPANLAGLPEEVAEACLDLVTYATRSAVNSYLANPTAVLSKVEENLRELMATASLTDTDERNQIIADINRAIACETADPQKITNLERKVGRKLDNWLTVAQGSFTNYLTGAQSASRTGRVLSQEEVTAQFAVLGIQPEVVAKKLGVAIGDPEPAFVTPQPEPEQTAQPAPKPVTLSTKATHDAAKPKFTINTVKSSQRVGGLAAAGAIVFTLATPTTAQATETTPSTPPAPQQSASAPAEVAPQTEPVAVQEIGADGGAVDITPAVSADTPAPGAEVIATIPNLKETTQPAEVVNEPAVTVSTTVNPITGEVTNVAKPAASAEANTPRENNQAATELLAKLTPAFRDGITRLNKAADHKSLNYLSQSDADVYGTKDPKTHKTIPIKLDEEYAATLQAQYDVLVAIIANDKTFIDSVTKMFDEMPLDKDKQAIIDTVEKIKFTEDGADDFEPAQKTALLTYIAYINTQTQSYAQNVVNARMSEYQKEQDAKAKAKAEQTTKSPEAKASNKYSLLIPKIRDEAQLAAAINAYIREVAPDSPFVGQGKNFVKGAKKHGVNPLIPVVIA